MTPQSSLKRFTALVGSLWMGTLAANAASLKVGDPAPDFTASSTEGPVHLKDQIGQAPIVIYFYPKDDTPGCTKEACGIRDHFAAFRSLNAKVYGVSYDSLASHRAFIKKFNLPFPLIADTDKTVAKLYGADRLVVARRMTFVIDKKGMIAWVNPSVDPSTHSQELEDVLKRLSAG